MYDVVIVGGAPAGLSAGVYSVRYNLSTLIVSPNFGGQMLDTEDIDNYPGFRSVSGIDLSKKMEEHAKALGCDLKKEAVTKIEKTDSGFTVCTETTCIPAKAVILTMGVTRRKLGIPGEKEFSSKGVSYCPTCDAAFFGGKTACVIGGGDSAGEAAELLARFASKVYLIYRSSEEKMRMKPSIKDLVKSKPNIEMIFNTSVAEIKGEKMMKSVVLDNGKEMPMDGLFVEIGYDPNTKFIKDLGITLDENGYILVDKNQKTNIPGIFAAGDCTDVVMRQVVVAAGQGAIAAQSAYQYAK